MAAGTNISLREFPRLGWRHVSRPGEGLGRRLASLAERLTPERRSRLMFLLESLRGTRWGGAPPKVPYFKRVRRGNNCTKELPSVAAAV